MAAAGERVAVMKLQLLPLDNLLRISAPVLRTLSSTPYSSPQGSDFSTKSYLLSLLPVSHATEPSSAITTRFFLCCAAIAAQEGNPDAPAMHWITSELCSAAKNALREVATGAGYGSVVDMVEDMMEVVKETKAAIKETVLNSDEDGDDADFFTNAASRASVGKAIVAAHQFRWMVSQVKYPRLDGLCWLLIPCALTALDHWSPEVKEQGMISFIHISQNVSADELRCYEEAILDVCCRNVPASDELWYRVVEMSVVMLTVTQRNNPRSPWLDQIFKEMLRHLERQPLNRERRVTWLKLVDPLFDAMGLFVLAHFRFLFSLFFEWLHVDDDETVILVLERLHKLIQLTWMRKSPHTERLVDELVVLYKESAIRKKREILRHHILKLLLLLQRCKGSQFATSWSKHVEDPDLTMLMSSFSQQLDDA